MFFFMNEKLIIELYNNNCIKFGNFTLKNGNKSSIYIDLKNIISYPHITNYITEIIHKKIKTLQFNRILGIQYGAIPIVSIISANYNIPMIMIRNEIKKYRFKNLIEGEYNENDKIIIIDDTISTGSSITKFLNILKKTKLEIIEIITICDRRETFDILKEYNIHSLFTYNDIIDVLEKNKRISNGILNRIILKKEDSIFFNSNKVIKKLIDIIIDKKNNNCFVLNFSKFNDIEQFIKNYHKDFCMIKIYSDTIHNFNLNHSNQLNILSNTYNFMIYEGKNFSYESSVFLNELTINSKHKFIDIINLSNKHDDEVFNTIKYLNKTNSKKISVVYDSITFNHKINKMLKEIIIGTNSYNFKDLFLFGYHIEQNIPNMIHLKKII